MLASACTRSVAGLALLKLVRIYLFIYLNFDSGMHKAHTQNMHTKRT